VPSSATKLLIAAGAVVAAVAIAVLYLFNPATAGFYPPCVFRAMTGLLCAGCGATRAMHHLLHGNLMEAVRLNAMFVVATPVLFAGGATEAWRALRGDASVIGRRPWIGWAIVVLLVGWGVVRNVVGI
jgi:hypothetical protein